MKRTLAEIANLINGKLCGDYDENLVITGATGIALAGPSEITFAVDPHLEEAIACNAAAVIIQEDVNGFSKTCIKALAHEYWNTMDLDNIDTTHLAFI